MLVKLGESQPCLLKEACKKMYLSFANVFSSQNHSTEQLHCVLNRIRSHCTTQGGIEPRVLCSVCKPGSS
jgi:hypothetical protein